MSTLIVVLPSDTPSASTPLEYLLTSDGQTATAHDRAVPALLPSATETVVLVPAQALSWHKVTLPRGTLARSALGGAGSAPRLRAVLEGLLEDRLLDEPADLHFALEPDARAQAPAWVAACNRAWLAAALTTLEAARRPVARIVPELTPAIAQLHVIGDPDQPQLAYAGEQGVVVLPLSAATLGWAQAQSGAPDTVEIAADPAIAALAEQLVGRPVTLHHGSDRWLAAARSTWDLAQLDLANSDRSRAMKRTMQRASALLHAPRWRAARWGVVALAAAHLAGLNAWALKESSALADKRAAVRATLTNTFPNVKVVVDAPVQMEREVALLRQATGAYSQRDLEAMLAALAGALPPTQSVQAIEFTGGEARLKGLTLDAPATAALNTKLQAAGLRARSEGDRWVIRPDGTGPSP